MPQPIITLDSIAEHFEDLEDPRCPINIQHPLPSVIVIAVMGILAGASGPTAIAKWAKIKKDLLNRGLDLPEGVPCKDVFRHVLTLLNPKVFQACFAEWIASLKVTALKKAGVEKPILAIDGKTLRRSHDKRKKLGALHSVSVWASELGLSLGQVACDDKSNEITAIPLILSMVNIEGAIITIDAMGTQKAIAREIVDRKGDFVLALKGNHGNLYDAVIGHMQEQLDNDFADVKVEQHETLETSHGRTDRRIYTQLLVPKDLSMLSDWKGLSTIGMVVRHYTVNGEVKLEARYYISSLGMGVQQFARAVRGHWGIENGCHWTLDMTFREDESRIREKNHRENFAWLNRLVLSLLKQHPSKQSIAMKRRSCGWDDNFLLEVLTGSTS